MGFVKLTVCFPRGVGDLQDFDREGHAGEALRPMPTCRSQPHARFTSRLRQLMQPSVPLPHFKFQFIYFHFEEVKIRLLLSWGSLPWRWQIWSVRSKVALRVDRPVCDGQAMTP